MIPYFKGITSSIIISAIIFISQSAYADGGVSVRAYTDKSAITIGDRIKLTIEVDYPRGAEIQMPDFRENMIGEFEIKDSGKKSDKRIFRRLRMKSWYYITAYSTGKIEIPPIDIKFKIKTTANWELNKTGALSVNVMSVLPKEFPSDIKDIKGPAQFFEINWIFAGLLLIILAILAASIILYMKIKNRKPVRLAHETALEELEAMRSQLINSGDLKEYFVGVSDCIRRYVERVFSLKAPEMTTEEFLNSLRDSAVLTIQHKDLLKGFMNACDMVKFAKHMPTSDETESLYVTAKNFVIETRGSK